MGADNTWIRPLGPTPMALTPISQGVSPPDLGVPISVGDNWQTVTDNNPAGTTFSIAPGTHTGQQVRPKEGNAYIASGPGVIMDGQSTKTFAFGLASSASPHQVTIDGIEMKNYVPSGVRGVVNCGLDTAASSATSWSIRNCYIHDSTDEGIRLGHGMTISDTTVARCGTLGIGGIGNNIVVERCSVYSNNSLNNSDGGGSKFVLTKGLTVRDTSWSSNVGPGLWLDIGNNGYLLERNTVSANSMEGIVVEISYSGIIRNNICRYNGMNDNRAGDFIWGAAIGVHASGGTGLTISNNTLEGNAHGVSLIQQLRGTAHGDPAGVDAEMYVQNVTVQNNTITLQTVGGFKWPKSFGATMGADDTGRNSLYSALNISISGNRYTLNSGTTCFAWNSGYRSASYWTGTAHFDTDGSFTL